MAVWIEGPDGAVAFLEDLAAFFKERLHIPDQFLLVQLFLGRAFGFLGALRDHSADWLHPIQRLPDDAAHLLCELLVLCFFLLGLQLFRGWARLRLFFRDVLQQGTLAHLVAVVVHHVAIVIDFFPDEGCQIARGQLSDQVAVSIAHLALASHLAP